MINLNNELLNRTNANLLALFPLKHFPITLDDIEKVYKRNVLGIQADAKTRKGTGKGYLTGIMYFAPASLSGVNICPKSSQGCRSACLFSAGRGRFYSITRARAIKTLAWHWDKARFIQTIKKSINSLLVKAKNKGLIPVVRLNGTSDILFEKNTDIIQSYPNIIFYDYTKISQRFLAVRPSNYHLTFSLSESNENEAVRVLQNGGNVAVVFSDTNFPSSYLGYSVVDGDTTDLRFLDLQNVVVALKAKGRAKQDTSGFVKDTGVLKNGIAA